MDHEEHEPGLRDRLVPSGRRMEDYHIRHSHGFNWAATGVIFALILNVAGMVWTAATMSSSISTLQAIVSEMKGSLGALTNQAVANAVRLGVLESKVDYITDEQRRQGKQ